MHALSDYMRSMSFRPLYLCYDSCSSSYVLVLVGGEQASSAVLVHLISCQVGKKRSLVDLETASIRASPGRTYSVIEKFWNVALSCTTSDESLEGRICQCNTQGNTLLLAIFVFEKDTPFGAFPTHAQRRRPAGANLPLEPNLAHPQPCIANSSYVDI